jgi:hypothetical protein
MLPMDFHVSAQEVREPLIIGVEKGNQRIIGSCDSPVAGTTNPAVGLTQEPYTGVFHASDNVPTAVSGPVVHHNALKILKCLKQH